MDVINVKGATFVKSDITASGDLSEAGQAGFHREQHRSITVVAELTRHEGAWSDERYITLYDIYELGQFIERGCTEHAPELRHAGIIVDLVTVFAIFFNEVRFAHFFEGFFGHHAAIFGLHGTEFVDFYVTIITRETGAGINRGGFWIGKFFENPNDTHRKRGEEEKNRTQHNIKKPLHEARAADERSDADENGRSVADKLEGTHLGSQHGARRYKIIEEMAVRRLAIDIFGMAIVGLENDIWFCAAEGFFQRGELFPAEIFRDEFCAGNNASERKTALGKSGNVVCEIFGVFRATDDHGAEVSATVAQGEAASEPDNAAKETEEDEASDDRIEGHDAHGEKIDLEEKIIGDNGHDTDDTGEKEATDFLQTSATEEDGFFIEAKRGEDENIDREEEKD